MAKRIQWEEPEALLLFDAYDLVKNYPDKRKEIVAALSINLRRRALDLRIVIDDIYRNNAGINMRLMEAEKILHPEASGLSKTSDLFRNTAELYLNYRHEFLQKLEDWDEYRVKILPELVPFDQYEASVLLDGYLKLITSQEHKAVTARIISEKLRTLAKNRGRIFNNTFRSEEGIKGRLNKMDQAFRGNCSQDSSVPQVFLDIVQLYYSDMEKYRGLLERANELIGTVGVRGDNVMTTNDNIETKFFEWMRAHLSENRVTSIERNYKTISLILLKQKIIKRSIFSITDVNELTKAKNSIPGCIAKLSMRSDALQLFAEYISYLKESTVEDSPVKAMGETKDIKTCSDSSVTESGDISQTDFYNWLSQHELMSGPTCRCYVSGIRSSEVFAKEHGYTNCSLFSKDTSAVINTVEMLLKDEIFTSQHSSYRPHLKKYLKYLGVETLAEPSTDKSIRQTKREANFGLLKEIEAIVKSSPNGIDATELENKFSNYSDSELRTAFQSASIIPVLGKFYHKDNIEDFDFLVETLYDTLCHQFNTDGGYTSAHALYKEAHPKLEDFFFYNSAFESKAEIYDLAAYLFGKAGYKDAHFIFYRKQHIWREPPDYAMDYGGLMIKYGREHGNVISRDEAMDYILKHGSSTPAQTVSLILNRSGWKNFFQYAENQFVLAEALNVDGMFLEILKRQIEILLEGEDYVALGDISDYFYSTLPSLPTGVTWGPLLLESILEHYDIGFITIDAGTGNDMKTIDAALLRKNSPFKTFADIVWNELSQDYQLPHTFSSEEFRLYLLKKGFLHGLERFNTVHKTVENDLRFYWTDSNGKVTVSNS